MLNALPVLPDPRTIRSTSLDVWNPGEVLRLMLAEDLGMGGGATYFLTSLLDHPDFTAEHLAAMPYAGLGGSPVPVAVTERAPTAGDQGLPLLRQHRAPLDHRQLHRRAPSKRINTDGHALLGVELRLDEDGQILAAGPSCSSATPTRS